MERSKRIVYSQYNNDWSKPTEESEDISTIAKYDESQKHDARTEENSAEAQQPTPQDSAKMTEAPSTQLSQVCK